ncbi:MAG: SAVED domain-containing protein [Roseicyclus sp.]
MPSRRRPARNYYPRELENLHAIYDRQIRGRYRDGSLEHLAVFGFAPIPILMELGRLLSDLTEVTVFGRHRGPRAGWAWPNDVPEVTFERIRGTPGPQTVALKLCVSAEISDDRITKVLGEDISIWAIRSSVVDVHALRNEADLSSFRKLVGRTLDEIRTTHVRS